MLIGSIHCVRYSALRSLALVALPGRELDVVCFSHLRWNFVVQRPQHLLTRCVRERRVFFFQEPLFNSGVPRLETVTDPSGVVLVIPHLPPAQATAEVTRQLRLVL